MSLSYGSLTINPFLRIVAARAGIWHLSLRTISRRSASRVRPAVRLRLTEIFSLAAGNSETDGSHQADLTIVTKGKLMFASSNAQRLLVCFSVAGAIIYGGACIAMGVFPPPAPALEALSVAHFYADHNIAFRIGVVICIITAGWSLPWTIALSVQMAREENGAPIWAMLQFGAGVLGVLIFSLPPVFWGIAAFSAGRDPALTLLMHETAFLFLVTPASFFPLQALPVGIISFARKRDALHAFPRWLGYLTIWMMATAELGVLAQLFRTGPFAWNGIFTFWMPIGVFVVWFTAINYCLLRAIRLQES